jgi:hypothetical protein
MRPTLAAALAAAALAPAAALAAPPAAPPAPVLAPAPAPPAPNRPVTDIQCIIVGGALAQSDDPDMQSLGRASLFYFVGRLEGRGDTDNLPARVVAEAGKMTADDIKADAQSCGAIFTVATQRLQSISEAFPKQPEGPPAAGPK